MRADEGGSFPGTLIVLQALPLDKILDASLAVTDGDYSLDLGVVLECFFVTLAIEEPLFPLLRTVLVAGEPHF